MKAPPPSIVFFPNRQTQGRQHRRQTHPAPERTVKMTMEIGGDMNGFDKNLRYWRSTLDKFVQPFFNAADNTVVAGGTIATDRVIVY